VLLFDLPVERGLARVTRRGAEDAFEQRELQERVRANFLTLAAADPAFRRVDAGPAPDDVAAAVWDHVRPLLERDP